MKPYTYTYVVVTSNGAGEHGRRGTPFLAAMMLEAVARTHSDAEIMRVKTYTGTSGHTYELHCAVCGAWTAWTPEDRKAARHCGRRRCQRALMDAARGAPAL